MLVALTHRAPYQDFVVARPASNLTSGSVERFKFQVSVALTLMLSASRDLSLQRLGLSS